MKKIYFEELKSTNSYLKENHSRYNNFDCIIANKQTNGRGRFDRKWESGNDITLSILFSNKSYNHAIISSLAVFETLKHLGINALIKWPNDIYVNDLKISGILIESIFESNQKKCDIVGIGINMNKTNNYPSIGILDLVDVSKDYVIDLLLENYKKLLNKDELYLRKEYVSNSLLIDKLVMYKDEEYKVIGITNDFKIKLKNKSGNIEVLSDEVKLIF